MRPFNRLFAVTLLSALVVAGCSQEPHEEGEAAGPVASSSAGLPKGHIAAGELLAGAKSAATGQSCSDCHGPDGLAPIDPTYPVIGGQYGDYLAQALQDYRDGDRAHALMSSQAKGLDDQQIADLSAYFASRSGPLVDLTDVPR
ncbi:MAG: c-type cytochrome [Pseudomonadota bacterium]|nr:c-type cytochrome [Pseudomonadota bacterium]